MDRISCLDPNQIKQNAGDVKATPDVTATGCARRGRCLKLYMLSSACLIFHGTCITNTAGLVAIPSSLRISHGYIQLTYLPNTYLEMPTRELESNPACQNGRGSRHDPQTRVATSQSPRLTHPGAPVPGSRSRWRSPHTPARTVPGSRSTIGPAKSLVRLHPKFNSCHLSQRHHVQGGRCARQVPWFPRGLT